MLPVPPATIELLIPLLFIAPAVALLIAVLFVNKIGYPFFAAYGIAAIASAYKNPFAITAFEAAGISFATLAAVSYRLLPEILLTLMPSALI